MRGEAVFVGRSATQRGSDSLIRRRSDSLVRPALGRSVIDNPPVVQSRASSGRTGESDLRLASLFFLILLLATSAFAQQSAITINDDQPVYAEGVPFMLTGTSLPGAIVTIAIEKSGNGQTTADASGHWTLIWTPPVKTGTWTITATSGGVTATQLLRVQIQGNVQRQPIIEPTLR